MRLPLVVVSTLAWLAVAGAVAAEPCESWSGGDRATLLRHAPPVIAERFRQDAAAYFGQSSDRGAAGATLVSVTRQGAHWYFVFDTEAYMVTRRTLLYDEAAPGPGEYKDAAELMRVCGSAGAEPR